MNKQKVHYIAYEVDIYPICGVYKNRVPSVTTNKAEVTCKACLRWNLDDVRKTADIIEIFRIAKASAKEESMET